MRQTEIENIKKFTNALFAGNVFDSFCVTEASFSTLVNITIDGHVNADFGKGKSEAETQAVQPEGPTDKIARWQQIRPLCYEAIKGDKPPVRFKVVFMTPPDKAESFAARHGLNIKGSDIAGLFMNIRFEGGKMFCVSGTSLKTFTLDKSLENAWDESVEAFLKKFG